MTKKARTVLFVSFLVLFALSAPIIIWYSQGYRFDFETKRIVQTGGLYFRVLPRSADVYLNGKLRKTTSIFTNSALIETLLPKTYSVEIKKGGYHAWQKSLEVQERQVTEAKNILLVPQNPGFSLLSSNQKEIAEILSGIKASATSSDKEKVIEADEHEIWISFVKSQAEEQEEKVFLTRFSEKIGQVLWLNDYYLIFNVGSKIKIVEIDDRDKINMVDWAEFKEPEMFWDRTNDKFYVLSENNLYLSEKLLP